MKTITVGVLDLQGSVQEHLALINKVELDGYVIEGMRVKYHEDLFKIDGLIIPGGESTTLGKLLNSFSLTQPLRQKITNGLPVWGTCAGLILLAKTIEGRESTHLSVMDIDVKRNAYGSQLDSFCISETIDQISETPIPLIFIRAPYINSIQKNVNILKRIDGNIVAAYQDNMLVTSFHPELTEDITMHKYFVEKFIL